MPAYRNISMCTKDCLCLFVCPTGATDTENSIIDVNKCIPGCRACVDSCPSGAISLLPDNYPEQQPKTVSVIAAQRELIQSKMQQELIASEIAKSADSTVMRQFADAIAKSNRITAEDLARESGYMLPQSEEAYKLIREVLKNAAPDFPKDAAEKLLNNH